MKQAMADTHLSFDIWAIQRLDKNPDSSEWK